MSKHNLVCWNARILGSVKYGQGKKGSPPLFTFLWEFLNVCAWFTTLKMVFALAGMIGDACHNVLFISNCQVILCCWHSVPNLHLLPHTFLLREDNTKKNRGMLLIISFANPLLYLFSIFCTTCIAWWKFEECSVAQFCLPHNTPHFESGILIHWRSKMSPVEIQSNVTTAHTHTFTTGRTYLHSNVTTGHTYLHSNVSTAHNVKYELLCCKSCVSGK